MSKKIITPLDSGYRPGMMTWSILQRFGVVSSEAQDQQQQHQQQQDQQQDQAAPGPGGRQTGEGTHAPGRGGGGGQAKAEEDAPSKQQKEDFRLALEVALSSSVISEDQVSCLWNASHPLRAKDVAKIAKHALLRQVSLVLEDAPGAVDRFSQVLTMLLAGSCVTSAQIRILVSCAHELTSETIQSVLEAKLREAYQKKESQKQIKAEEEQRFRDKFREVLQLLDGPTALSEEAFQLLLAASITLKAGAAEEIMASVGTSWDDLHQRCIAASTTPSSATVSVPQDSATKFSTGPERDCAEAMLVRAAAATAEGLHSDAVELYKDALEVLIQLLKQETTVIGKSELSNYIDYYMNMAERAKAQATVTTDGAVKKKSESEVEEEMDLEDEFYDCAEPPAPVKPPKPVKPAHIPLLVPSTTELSVPLALPTERPDRSPPVAPPRPPPPPPPPRTTTATQPLVPDMRPPKPPPPPRRATITLDTTTSSNISSEISTSPRASGESAPSVRPPAPPPPARRSSTSSAALSPPAATPSSLRPRPSLDLLSSIQAGSHTLKKVEVSDHQTKKVEEGSSLMGQLSHMIDKRRVYLQDDSDSSSDDSDFD